MNAIPANDLPRDDRQGAFPIVIVGHVDHGKSTLVGRLLHETKALQEGQLERLQAVSEKRGLAFEWSFLLDALQVERDQGITVDTSQIWFSTSARRYVIIDAPGHKEFLKNMLTGAAQAEAAVLVVDATQGLAEQTRRHAYLLQLLGIRRVIVALNKIDLIGFDQESIQRIGTEVGDYLARLGLSHVASVPLSARHGDNIAARGKRLPWYRGATLVETLDRLAAPERPVDRPLRLPIQDLYRQDDKRVLVGRIESGRLRLGDRLRFLPSGREAKVASFESWPAGSTKALAIAGESIAFTLDDDVFLERGSLAARPSEPPALARDLLLRLFWLDRDELKPGDTLRLKLATSEVDATLLAIEEAIDVERLSAASAAAIERNGIARARFRLSRTIPVDRHGGHEATARGVLLKAGRIAAAFVIEDFTELSGDVRPVAQSVDATARAARNGHRGGVIWLTGLSGAGKSTLALAATARLFAEGAQAFVLDGDTLRHGLNSDLGFSAAERSENVRRLAEVAKLMVDAGLIVFVAAISPTLEDRRRARAIIGAAFREVHVDAPLATCEARDPKQLYQRARRGEIAEFTGVSAPYEAPAHPDLHIATDALSPDEAARRLHELVQKAFF